MAFENLFIRSKKSIGGIELDAVLSESHSNTVRLTKNPIELGADITDHAFVEPKKITVVAQVSDTPLGTAALGQIVDLVTGLFGSSTSSNLTRSNAAYNSLIQILELREPIDVQTKLKLYQDMVIVNISTTQDKDTSRVIMITVELEEVLITESQTVQLSADQFEEGSVKEQASPADNKGRQETTTPNSSTNSSVLKSVLGWVGG